MGFRVDYGELNTLCTSIKEQSDAAMQRLVGLGDAMDDFGGSCMSGAGADAIRSYFQNAYGSVTGMLISAIAMHAGNCFLYNEDYQSNIDPDLYTVIVENELSDISEDLEAERKKTIAIFEETEYALSQIRDIFSVSYPGVGGTDTAHSAVTRFASDLKDKINALEDKHDSEDFVRTGQLLSEIEAMILHLTSKGRDFKTHFDAEAFFRSEQFQRLYAAYISVEDEYNSKDKAIDAALTNEENRLQQIEIDEMERRREAAKWITYAGIGLGIVAGICVTALTGGAAAPLVVAGLASAASGAVIGASSSIAGQYAESGSIDWGKVGLASLKGGAIGALTGVIGGAVGGAVTSGLGQTALGSTLLNSSSSIVRIGSGAVIGSASQVSSGIVTRGVETYITSGGDMDAALDRAFDSQSMTIDAVMGGVTGGYRANKQPVGKQISEDDISKELLETKPDHSPDPKKWISEKGGKVYVDGNGTWTYEAADGTAVCYSEGYPDFDRAGLVE